MKTQTLLNVLENWESDRVITAMDLYELIQEVQRIESEKQF